MSGHPFSPVPHPMWPVETHPGGRGQRPFDGVYNGEMIAVFQERRIGCEMDRKTINITKWVCFNIPCT